MQPNQLDPGVARIAADMPIGAISNPIPVPGGFSIITMRAKREIGRDMATMLSLRQAFIPFATPLNPAAPTEQQHQALDRAKSISASVHTCDAMEAANRSAGAVRPADPGPVRLENVNPPQLRQLLASLPFDHASQPLVAGDGIAVVIVCSRDQKNVAEQSPEEVRNQILSERIELASRQLQRDLQRRATIDRRDANAS
jgi:peptidyl-prolyl cis-trans isomerase SurA